MTEVPLAIILLVMTACGEPQANPAQVATHGLGYSTGPTDDLGIGEMDAARVLVEFEDVLSALEPNPEGPWGATENFRIYRLVERAAELKDARLRAPLCRVVLAFSEARTQQVAFLALDALWKLGEDRAFFENAVERHEERPWQAIFSMLILGRVPDREQHQRFAAITSNSTANGRRLTGKFADAATAARAAISLDGEYQKVQSHPDRVRYLLPVAFAGYYAMGDIWDMYSRLAPKAAWARDELERLSVLAPHDVVEALLELGVGEVKPTPGCTDEELALAAARWEKRVLSCLGKAAQDLWNERKYTRETSKR